MNRFDLLLPLGPGDREVGRARDLVEALGHHEPGPWRLTIVDDDGGRDRGLADAFPTPAGCTIQSVTHAHDFAARRRYVGGDGRFMCGNTMTGLAAVVGDVGEFIVKLDSDALVIGPFADRLRAAFAARPDVGLLGACTRTPRGAARDTSMHAGPVRRAHRPPLEWRHPRRSLWHRREAATAPARALIGRALAGDYEPGDHALGGALALRGAVLTELAADGLLDSAAWEGLDLSEDVMIGLLPAAAGYGQADLVGAGEVFGVAFQGLPYPPAELLDRGYALIHAVKNDPDVSEADIRAFFRARRVSG